MNGDNSIISKVKNWFYEHPHRIKLVLSCINFCAIIFAYSIIKAVKDSIFLSMVGSDYQPYAKQIVIATSIFLFMPIYSKLIATVQRKNISITFLLFYACFCTLLCLGVIHPTIGLANVVRSPWRILGWLSYVIFEFFNVAVLGTFWGLLNSISTPESSKNQYGILAIASRSAGITASIFGLFVSHYFSKSISFPLLLITSAIMLCVSALCVKLLFQLCPEKYLTGYSTTHTDKKKKPSMGFISGLKTFVKTPYVLGIFILVCAIEIISTIMDYKMQCAIDCSSSFLANSILFKFFIYTLSFQILGLFLAIFATTNLPKKIGIRSSLLITPLATLLCVFVGFGADGLLTAMLIQIAIRGFNYGFYEPVREMLFVPTSTEIQFSVKGWIDTFGKTASKAFGGMINIAATYLYLTTRNYFLFGVAGLICILWLTSAFLVGTKYQSTIANDELIE